jgi:hypothetical protein
MQTNSLPTIAWTRILGTSVTAENISLTTGLDGSIYVTDSTNVSLDGQTISGGWDTYITKYTPDGTKVWTRLLGSSSTDISCAITTGLDGSIYVGGRTQSWLDGQINSGGYDAFITKYNPDGTKDWTRLLGTNGEEYVVSLNTGLDGSIYLGGSTTGSLEGQVNNGFSSFDAYITKFTADGAKVWTRLVGSRADQYARATTTSQDGSIYLSGDTWGSIDGQPYIGGQSDVFITKYSPDGTKVWTRLLGSTSDDYASAMASGVDGSIYVCGWSTGSLDGQINSGGFDAFVTKYSPDGTHVWTRMIGTSSSDRANAITIDLDGSVYVSGWTTGSLDRQVYGGNTDAFVTKYDPDGTKVWTRLFGTSSSELSTSLTKGIDGSIYLGGWTTGSPDGLQTIKGGSDAFIIKLSSPSTPTPTIAISSNTTTLKADATALITFTLSEASTTFTASDVAVVGGILSNFKGSGATYTATFNLTSNTIAKGSVSVSSGAFSNTAGNFNTDGTETNNIVFITRSPTVTNENHILSVIVDKNVLASSATLLKGLKESITYSDGVITNHLVEYSGLTFDYNQIDSLITTVIRDGEFTAEFTKEINDYLGAAQNITYSAAVAIVGAVSIDGVILSVAGADGNFVG